MITNKGDIIMKRLFILFAMLISFVSCDKSVTEPMLEPLPNGTAIIEALILDVDYPTWTTTIEVQKILRKGIGCPVWEGDTLALDNSPYDYTVSLRYKLTLQYIPTYSGPVWGVIKEDISLP